MGGQISQFAYSERLTVPQNCKLYSILPIGSASEQQEMTQILQKRIKLAQCPAICTIKGYDFINEQSNRLSCSQDKKLVVYYDNFDYRLIDVSIRNYKRQFNETQFCSIIKSVTSALIYLRSLHLHHGDVSLENICKRAKGWRLIDKIFIKNGINAYEKVLEGESGFISPKQMIRIRYGFVKQSPELSQADDIFGLGMVILQLASEVPSSLCYKQKNVRFNQDIFQKNLNQIRKNYSKQFYQLLERMLNFQQDERIGLNEIVSYPLINGSLKHISPQESYYNLSQPKIKASDLRFNTYMNSGNIGGNENMRSNLTIYRKQSDSIIKPLTPATTAVVSQYNTKQTSPIVPNTPRLPTTSVKSSQFFSYPLQQRSLVQDQPVNHGQRNGKYLATARTPYPPQPGINAIAHQGRNINFNPHRLKTIN